eukprot:1159472-Pelagomonas_calceolata.AAC.15
MEFIEKDLPTKMQAMPVCRLKITPGYLTGSSALMHRRCSCATTRATEARLSKLIYCCSLEQSGKQLHCLLQPLVFQRAMPHLVMPREGAFRSCPPKLRC